MSEDQKGFFMHTIIRTLLVSCIGFMLISCSDDKEAVRKQAAVNQKPLKDSFFDLFASPDPNINIRVNKYIWTAAQDTLSFLPLEGADPFSGVIVFGFGRAPGSGQVYRATVFVQDPALDARSLKVSIQRRAGGRTVPASAETTRRVEDAILSRARQLRIADAKL